MVNTYKMEIEKQLQEITEKSKKIVIYPYGYWGGVVEELLRDHFKIRDYTICDNYSNSPCVKKPQEIILEGDYVWIICCENTKLYVEIRNSLNGQVNDENIIDIFENKHNNLFIEPEYAFWLAERENMTPAQWYIQNKDITNQKNEILNIIKENTILDKNPKICEIGPGMGIFIEGLKKLFQPSSYEIYEKQKEIANKLIKLYSDNTCHVIGRTVNGTMMETGSNSQDLVLSVRVWPILFYSEIYSYFLEMIRICKKGGYVIFDACTERSLSKEALENNYIVARWRALPSSIIEQTFKEHNMTLILKADTKANGWKEELYIYQK